MGRAAVSFTHVVDPATGRRELVVRSRPKTVASSAATTEAIARYRAEKAAHAARLAPVLDEAREHLLAYEEALRTAPRAKTPKRGAGLVFHKQNGAQRKKLREQAKQAEQARRLA